MREQTLCQQRIMSGEYHDFILGNKVPDIIKGIDVSQRCEQELPFGYTCVSIESLATTPLNLNVFYYNTIPDCYELLDLGALDEAGITDIQNYPTLQLRGENVLMGFIDTGIDYTNAVFKDLGGNTRIEAIWDQNIQEGEPPKGIQYGTEYRKAQINAALKEQNPFSVIPSRDEDGHGTYVASVAAGSLVPEEQFSGGAPESSIAVVKLKGAKSYLREYYYIKPGALAYQENDIIQAIQYLRNLSLELEMPLVICLALGSNLGSHTGISPLCDVINEYADEGEIILVTGVGNEANERHHYLSKKEQVEEVEIRVGANVGGFILELWTEIPNLLAISVISPSGEALPPNPLQKGLSGEYFFLFEGTKVYIDYRLLIEKSNSELIFFRFTKPVEGIWKIRVEQTQMVSGVFHMWCTSSKFSAGEVVFLESQPDTTIMEPGNSIFPITVAYYDSDKNSVDVHSGRGYTRIDRVKPDFVAPGVNVKGALPRGAFAERTGSSVATAITAGAAALLTEWVVYQLGQQDISSIQIKNLLTIGTTRTETMEYPNKKWGYGKLDLYNTFEILRRL